MVLEWNDSVYCMKECTSIIKVEWPDFLNFLIFYEQLKEAPFSQGYKAPTNGATKKSKLKMFLNVCKVKKQKRFCINES